MVVFFPENRRVILFKIFLTKHNSGFSRATSKSGYLESSGRYQGLPASGLGCSWLGGSSRGCSQNPPQILTLQMAVPGPKPKPHVKLVVVMVFSALGSKKVSH